MKIGEMLTSSKACEHKSAGQTGLSDDASFAKTWSVTEAWK